MFKSLVLSIAGISLVSAIDSCLWCISQGNRWDSTFKQCGSTGNINTPVDCYYNEQFPEMN